MKSIRNLVLLAVVTILSWTLVGATVQAQTFVPAPLVKDTVFNGVTGSGLSMASRLLQGTFSGLGANDSLFGLTLKSCIQKEFAIQRILVFKKVGAGTPTQVGTFNINGRFDENFEVAITGINAPFANGDSIIFTFDAWTDSVDTDTTYHETGLELVIPNFGIKLRNNGTIDSTVAGLPATNPGAFRTSFDDASCNPNPPGEYTRIFDLFAPTYNVAVAILDTTTFPNSCTNMINIGDSIRIVVSNPNEELQSNSVTVDLTAFGGSATHALNYHANGAGFADDTWTDTIRVAAEPAATGTDVIPGLVIAFNGTDNAGNNGGITYTFTEAIDNIAPVIDSVQFYISQNNVGSDQSAAVGDRLSLIVYMTSNGPFEINDVTADFSNFRSDSTGWELDDITNGNGIWRVDVWLTSEMARDIAAGSDPLKYVMITAHDNACNQDTVTVNFDPALDLELPIFSSLTYRTVTNADSSSCTNLGDSIRITADMSLSDDLDEVWTNFLDGGLGGATDEALGAIGGGEWELRWKIGNLTDPNFDPNTLDAKDANSLPTDADYTVWVYAVDDAGNADSLQSGSILGVLGGAAVLDTRRPTAIVQDDVSIEQLPGGKLRLVWPVSSQAGDAQYFFIYVDSTGSGFNTTGDLEYNYFGTTFNGEYVNAGPDSNAWTSEVLTHGKQYSFLIRTMDDCGNGEYNNNIFQGTPDAVAPVACVVFPATGGQYGPNSPLFVTATSPDEDIAAAWFVHRKKDRGDGTPGAWQYYPVPNGNMMSDFGQTFRDTINLGTNPSTEGVWEALILTTDDVGNVQTLAEAEAACGFFEFIWNPNTPVCDFLTINGAFAPQTACGFEVTRPALNTAEVTVMDAAAGEIYTVDTWVIFTTSGDRTRIDYADNVGLPYEFQFDVSDWPKTVGGALPTYLITEITDNRNGAFCVDSVRICIPDEFAPQAFISDPLEYQCVPLMGSSLVNPVEVTVTVDPDSYDASNPIRAELFWAPDGNTAGTKIGEAAFVDDEAVIEWDNSGLEEGYVWLYAIVYDDVNNSYQTPFVRVCLDGTMPEMTLKLNGGSYYAGCADSAYWRLGENTNNGFVELAAELVNLSGIDIANVYFYYQDANDAETIDVFYFWNYIGQGEPANNNSIWKYDWDYADALDCGRTYRVRVAVEDAAGNWMLDMDGDGYFDDYTFDDAVDQGAGITVTYDCEAPQPVVTLFESDGEVDRSWSNPSTWLGGSGDVYAKMGEILSVEVGTNPSDDSCEVSKVDYFLCGTFVGTSASMSDSWRVTFDPFAMGIVTAEDVANDYYSCELEARMYDELGQYSSDYIDVYFLDITPAHVLITEPGAGSYVCGEVDLELGIFDAHNITKVTWYYWLSPDGPKVKIADVYGYEPDKMKAGSLPTWGTTWHIALNTPPNGDYVIGAEITDIAGNVTEAEDGSITVHVNCNLPSVVLQQPESSFFCEELYLCATPSVNDGSPIDVVWFEYKPFNSDEWVTFDNSSDYDAPWCATVNQFDGEEFEIDNEGYYQIRAAVENKAGFTTYSEPVTMFYDETAPRANFVAIVIDGDTLDLENNNDPTVGIPAGTSTVTFIMFAKDDQSPWGPSPIYNSGIGSICAQNVCVPATPDENGYFTVTWDLSGLTDDEEFSWSFTVVDAAGCNSTHVYQNFAIVAGEPPFSMVVGCFDNNIVGVTEYGSTAMFQYRQNGGEWIPIAYATSQDNWWLLEDDWSYTSTQWAVFTAPWAPANGTYEVRMLADDNDDGFDESLSPISTITVGDNGCFVDNREGYGPGTIERNLENDCDNLEGLATIGSGFGMPFGVAASYNVSTEVYDYYIFPFTRLNQQGESTRYSGAFRFDALVDDGFGYGRVFFADFEGMEAWSTYADYQTFWVSRDFGTGGPVTFQDVTVDIPAEWTDYDGTDASALAIWKSKIARPSVWQDWLFTPVGDNNGMMTYLTDPSCSDLCGDDEQYAIVTMQYNNTVTTPAESLYVAWWDGEGVWRTENVYFTSIIDPNDGRPMGFYKVNGQNYVKFAVTCFGDGFEGSGDAWYSVVKKTEYDPEGGLRRFELYPYCNGFTGPYPYFAYQATEPFNGTIDWGTLEVYLDGIRLMDRDGYTAPDSQAGSKVVNSKTALDEADFVDIWYDEVAAQIYVEFYGSYYIDGEIYYTSSSLTCGAHQLKVRVEDSQHRPQTITDNFMVDCTEPDVDFANRYVSRNPTITFTIDDAESGVDWDHVFVDVFFVTKGDTTAGGPDNGEPKEKVAFIQTFFPDQIKDYLQEDGRTVEITTTYDLDDERGLIAVVYDGYYDNSSSDYGGEWGWIFDVLCGFGLCNTGDPSEWDNFDHYYYHGGGASDCADNYADPHVQYFTVDYDGAAITMTSPANSCPLTFSIEDDGAGVESVEIRENGTLVGSAETSASEVDAAGEWYFGSSTNGGTLYYCPSSGAAYEIRVTDMLGIASTYTGSPVGPIESGDVTGWAGPNPYDPESDPEFAINVELARSADIVVRIYNYAGELVKTINAGTMGAGASRIAWDGRTDDGTQVADGAYMARIEASGGGQAAAAVVWIAVVEK